MNSQPKLVINRRILSRVLSDVTGHPDVEIGGRWVGHHIEPGGTPSQSGLHGDPERAMFVILDYVPTGPTPEKRTAVELQPDRGHRLWTSRRLHEADNRIEVLGSWHSHIPNGLNRFSNGDHHSYHSKINNPVSPYPFTGIVCSLIHQMPKTEEDVLQSLGHAWFAVGDSVGEHSWFNPEEIVWTQMSVPEEHLLDLEDYSAYLSATGRSDLKIEDWARAIDEVAQRSGQSDHQLRMHPSGERILLIENAMNGVEYAVEISNSGENTLHIKDSEGSDSTSMSSVGDAMAELEDRLRQSGNLCAPWSHVNSTLAISLRAKKPRGWFRGLIARIFRID